MTKVICITRNNQLSSIKVEGHAAYAQKGFDIVRAAISSIVEGASSFFESRHTQGVIVSRDRTSTTFSVFENHDHGALQVCLQMLIHQLKNISHFYPNYIAVFFR